MNFRSFLPVLLIPFLIACNKNEQPIIIGQVVSSSGEPIANAHIHVSYTIDESQVQSKSTKQIFFRNSKTGDVSLKSYRYWNNNLIETIVDQKLGPGHYSFTLTDTLYTDGIYYYELKTSSNTMTHKWLIARDDVTELIEVQPLCKTSKSGGFKMELEILGIGEKFELYAEHVPEVIAEQTITNRIEFIAIKNGQIIARETVQVKEEKGNNIRLVAK